jgi:hypothetical protein
VIEASRVHTKDEPAHLQGRAPYVHPGNHPEHAQAVINPRN